MEEKLEYSQEELEVDQDSEQDDSGLGDQQSPNDFCGFNSIAQLDQETKMKIDEEMKRSEILDNYNIKQSSFTAEFNKKQSRMQVNYESPQKYNFLAGESAKLKKDLLLSKSKLQISGLHQDIQNSSSKFSSRPDNFFQNINNSVQEENAFFTSPEKVSTILYEKNKQPFKIEKTMIQSHNIQFQLQNQNQSSGQKLQQNLNIQNRLQADSKMSHRSNLSNVSEIFNVRPATSGSGIGGIQEMGMMNKTQYAMAGSPMKQERGRMAQHVKATGMKNPNDFHPQLSYNTSSVGIMGSSQNYRFKQDQSDNIQKSEFKLNLQSSNENHADVNQNSQSDYNQSEMQKTSLGWLNEHNINIEVENEQRKLKQKSKGFADKVKQEQVVNNADEELLIEPDDENDDQDQPKRFRRKNQAKKQVDEDPFGNIQINVDIQQQDSPQKSLFDQRQEYQGLFNVNQINQDISDIQKQNNIREGKDMMNFTMGNFNKDADSYFDNQNKYSDSDENESYLRNESEILAMENTQPLENKKRDRRGTEIIKQINQKPDGDKSLMDTFNRNNENDDAFTFDDRSETNIGSQMADDCLQSHLQKFYDNHYETKNLGYIKEVNQNLKNLGESIDFERSKSYIYGSSFNEGTNFGRKNDKNDITAGISQMQKKFSQFNILKNGQNEIREESFEQASQSQETNNQNNEDFLKEAEDFIKNENEPLDVKNSNIDDDMISVISKKIPILNKDKNADLNLLDLKIIMEKEQSQILLEEQFKQIDFDIDMQIFNGPRDPPKQQLEIKQMTQLGNGGQAKVYQVRIKGMKGEFVDKTCSIKNNRKLAEDQTKKLYYEFCIAKDLNHTNIVHYMYFMRQFDQKSKQYDCHIVMELLEGGDMDMYLREQGRPIMIERVQEIGGQLISGIKYLHDSNIIHQDLKPQNIIFKNLEYDTIKLIDLGVSNRLEETREHTSAATAGTMRYMPPEQLNGSLSFKTDIWGFGCVLLQFSTGLRPFNDIDHEVAASMKIFQGCSPMEYALKNYDSDCLDLINENQEFKTILHKCLQIDYKKRPTAEELFNDPFFSGYTKPY